MNWASGAPVMKGSSACTVVSAANFHSCKQGHKTDTNLLSNKVADFNMQKRKRPYPETSPQTLHGVTNLGNPMYNGLPRDLTAQVNRNQKKQESR